ncbi:MAG: HAMP domain-containing protein [Armatimonadetes bacterium]|nr:HAMP domain-containing protein [Armatimonadota bacterium]
MKLRGRLVVRLIALYGLMAILPCLIGLGLLTYYLRERVLSANFSLRQETLRSIKEGNKKALQSSSSAASSLVGGLSSRQRAIISQNLESFRKRQQQDLDAQLSKIATSLGQQSVRTGQQTAEIVRKSHQDAVDKSLALYQKASQTVSNEAASIARTSVSALVGERFADAAKSMTDQCDLLQRNYLAMLALVSKQHAVIKADPLESRWILENLRNREPLFRALALVGPDWQPIAKAAEDSDWIDKAIESAKPLANEIGQAEISSEVVRIEGQAYPWLPALAPVKSQGELVGYVAALIDIENIVNSVVEFRSGSTGSALLFDNHGNLLAGSRHASDSSLSIDVWKRLSSTLESSSRYYEEIELNDDNKWLVSGAKIPGVEWTLVKLQRSDEAFKAVSQLTDKIAAHSSSATASMKTAILSESRKAANSVVSATNRNATAVSSALDRLSKQAIREAAIAANVIADRQMAQTSGQISKIGQAASAQIAKELAVAQAASESDLERSFGATTEKSLDSLTERTRSTIGLVLLIVALLGTIGSLIIAKTVVAPIRSLQVALKKIEQGDLSARISVSANDEIGALSTRFNEMAETLDKSQRELTTAQSHLVQSAKLASLGTLASGVAHELNQPLAIIRAIAQQHASAAPDPDALHQDLKMIETQTGRMMKIISHLRTFARKSGDEFDPVSVNEVFQNALVLLREQFNSRGIRIVEAYCDDAPPIMGDANSLEQIAINLLTNARDAVENEADAVIKIITSVEDGFVLAVVEDNGPGVPDDVVPQLFDPFFTTKDPGKGTGLGLPISAEIAQKHKGTLTYEPASGQGAKFALRLPIIESRADAA